MLDQTDIQILKLLSDNSRLQWQEIGDLVHMTGQAVKNRVSRMEKSGVIEGYTLKIDNSKLGKNITGFITVFMKTLNHGAFHDFIKSSSLVSEAHRISGEGCYMLKFAAGTQVELTAFLDCILEYGNYKLSISIGKLK